ncbi:HSCB C-terminal oligomerization domain containing protein [Nitzschia inconspicua]|uniref:HSCB C-terminal oligomerization domain containing protein n=1 Tax=Nitzschia inconspicua TaxID=303405 RepID=A0A9K3PWY8_9STRA|nr:HSCB C-terminal oligomerization domain containing protein [Nitzschia inconspicua]
MNFTRHIVRNHQRSVDIATPTVTAGTATRKRASTFTLSVFPSQQQQQQPSSSNSNSSSCHECCHTERLGNEFLSRRRLQQQNYPCHLSVPSETYPFLRRLTDLYPSKHKQQLQQQHRFISVVTTQIFVCQPQFRANNNMFNKTTNEQQQQRNLLLQQRRRQSTMAQLDMSADTAMDGGGDDDDDGDNDTIDDCSVNDNDNIMNENTKVMDYFAIFGMPRQYDIDLKELKQRYLQLMNEYHPDKLNHQQQQNHHHHSTMPQSSQQSLVANDITNAYQVLTESHTRANHLLELIGHPILEETKSSKSSSSSSSKSSSSSSVDLVGMDFLLQIMEWRERIETLALCSKHINDGIPCSCGSHDKNQELREMHQQTQALQRQCEDELSTIWHKGFDKNHNNESYDTDHDDDDDDYDQMLHQARTLTAQLQYWHRLDTAIREELEL